jgi:Aluminium activated malate transporter
LLIIGYALEVIVITSSANRQVTKIGVASVEQTGQTFFPVYKLAPFRILVTIIGVFLAFIFTIFPYPITSRDILRQDISREFQLLAKFYVLTQAQIQVIARSDGTKESQALKKLVWKEAFKCLAVQARCNENLAYTSWEPSLKYRFPKETYAALMSSLQRSSSLYPCS